MIFGLRSNPGIALEPRRLVSAKHLNPDGSSRQIKGRKTGTQITLICMIFYDKEYY